MLQALAEKKAFLKKANGKKGFTLVELVVVIAILAILAAIAIPTINNLIADANKSTDMANAQTIEVAIKTNIAQVAAKTEGATLSGGVETGTVEAMLTTAKGTFQLRSDILKCKTKDCKFYYNPTTGTVTPKTSGATGDIDLTDATVGTGGVIVAK